MPDLNQMTSTIQQAEEAIAKVSSTAGAINDAYVKTKNVIEQGRRYYDVFKSWVEKFQEWLEKLEPYITPVKNFWLKISNNNEPKRVLVIVLVVVVVIVLWKLRNLRAGQKFDR
ncbi:MAG: hypothetical protein Q7K39_03430 [Candidatus Magasanikbacteria bacterium]|nr:hypothetical protein [Candidatus Magasanikbacteria bacterium]